MGEAELKIRETRREKANIRRRVTKLLLASRESSCSVLQMSIERPRDTTHPQTVPPRGRGRWTYLQLPSSTGTGMPVAISGCVCMGTGGLPHLGRLEAGTGRLACGRALWQVCAAAEHTTLS